MKAPSATAQKLIDDLVRMTGAADPVSAVRARAEQTIDAYVGVFGEPEDMPLDLLALASFFGIRLSTSTPAYSPDAEIAPDGEGGVEMRLHPDRPETRQRFSIGHEITHTFFPDHASHVWPRADARYRDLSDPNDYLEMLCDAGAAELVFPRRWFAADVAAVRSAEDLVALAGRYKASREATLRRYAEVHPDAVAAVFFAWALKPTQHGRVGNANQMLMFGLDAAAEAVAARRLRVDYSIASALFSASGRFIPKHKSIANDGPLFDAALHSRPCDGVCDLDLGPASGRYELHAVPLWTSKDERGPMGESAVAAIVRPCKMASARRSLDHSQQGLFK